MAYMNQEKKKQLAPAIKAVFKKYGVKGTISVGNHSTLVVTVREGKLDFIGSSEKYNQQQSNDWFNLEKVSRNNYLQVNHYYAEDRAREVGEDTIADFYRDLLEAMRGADWFDKSDIQTDYFHTAYYTEINIGRWNKPYKLV